MSRPETIMLSAAAGEAIIERLKEADDDAYLRIEGGSQQ